jgi:hypothetical protein
MEAHPFSRTCWIKSTGAESSQGTISSVRAIRPTTRQADGFPPARRHDCPFAKRKAFTSDSFIGSEIAEFRLNGEKPPRTAKLVVSLSWSWSPAHYRSATYQLSANPRKNRWTLWEKSSDYDTGKPMYACVALGEPYKGCSPELASKELLTAAWRGEISQGSSRKWLASFGMAEYACRFVENDIDETVLREL